MVKSMNFFAFCSLDEEKVLCCEALAGGALTLQQCSVPESCSLNSCLGNKDTLLCGCNIPFFKKENEHRHTRTHTKRLKLSHRNGVTHEPTCTYTGKHRMCWIRTIAFLFVVICIFTYNLSKLYELKALSSQVPSCPVWLCSTCLHTWPSPVDIFYLPPGQRLAIKSLADITMLDLFYACFPSRLHFHSMLTSLVDFLCSFSAS